MREEKARDDALTRLEQAFLALLRDPATPPATVEAFLGNALEAHPELTEEILGLAALAEALDLADSSGADRLAREEEREAGGRLECGDAGPGGSRPAARGDPGSKEGDLAMAKVGVILSGCGVMDGTEIHESVLTLLALDRAGATVHCLAPRGKQMHVIDHVTGEEAAGEERDIFVESARIARACRDGTLRDLADVRGTEYDAYFLPGGFGAAKNLSTFAVDGANAKVHPDVERVLREAHGAGKVICAICIAPAILARVFGEEKVTVTIGNDEGTAKALESMGARHEGCPVDHFVVDREHRVVTTPAYMLGPSIRHVAAGIEKAVAATLEMVG